MLTTHDSVDYILYHIQHLTIAKFYTILHSMNDIFIEKADLLTQQINHPMKANQYKIYFMGF